MYKIPEFASAAHGIFGVVYLFIINNIPAINKDALIDIFII